MKVVTDREKAVLFALAAGQVGSWHEAYILANQKPEEEVKRQVSISSTASRWKARAEIQNAYRTAAAAVVALQNEIQKDNNKKPAKIDETKKENEPGDSERTETKKRGAVAVVDYSNPAEQTRKLNELINEASDPGEALDALKVIIQSQRADKEAAREGRRVQFYAPLRCRECPLYEKASEKQRKALQ